MTASVRGSEEEYWDWLAVALFLLISVDLLTTLGAAARVGVDAEANPLVKSLLGGPLWLLVAANLAALVAAVGGFALVLRLFDRSPPGLQPGITTLLEAWLGVLVAAGLVVFANNLSVVVHGVSLL